MQYRSQIEVVAPQKLARRLLRNAQVKHKQWASPDRGGGVRNEA